MMRRRRSKYGNHPTIIMFKGKMTRFDSEKEAMRAKELELMQKGGLIKDLQRQVKFELQPAFTHNGKKIQAINYIADFTYTDEDGNYIIEDSKGVRTREYIIKQKMMLYRGYEIKET